MDLNTVQNKRYKVKFNNITIETTTEFAVRIIEIIQDMFFINSDETSLGLDNPSISQLKKATLSKFFLILEVELKAVVKSKQKLIEELPILLKGIFPQIG